MKIDQQLDELLKKQARHSDDDADKAQLKWVARSYALAENAIAVLSDMKLQTSTIYYGKVGEWLGIARNKECHEISSIWEEEIMCRIHPDDLITKQIEELKFFHFLRSENRMDLGDYICVSNLRMCDEKGVFHNIRHKILYPDASGGKPIRFSLCIYTAAEKSSQTGIINSVTGQMIPLDKGDYNDLLSAREKEILTSIDQGLESKQIAQKLSISFHTVSRHRANIRQKLNAQNTVDALRIAKGLHLIG